MKTTITALGRSIISAKARQALHLQEVLSALWSHAQAAARSEAPRFVSTHCGSAGAEFQIVTDTTTGMSQVCLCTEADPIDKAGTVEDWICNSGCPSCGG